MISHSRLRRGVGIWGMIAPLILVPFSACSQQADSGRKDTAGGNIRPPAVAGSFYPSDPGQLARMVDDFLKEAKSTLPKGRIVALIAPHAGYPYSGKTAGCAFKLLEGSGVKTVLLVGCSHRAYFPGVSIYGGDGYRTPLGVVPVDKKLASWVREQDRNFDYYLNAHSREHSLEIELPFLQRVLKKFNVVPILIGQADEKTVGKLGKVLAKAMEKTPDAVIVCSTDLTHYPPERDARRIDLETLDAIKSMDRERIRDYLANTIKDPEVPKSENEWMQRLISLD